MQRTKDIAKYILFSTISLILLFLQVHLAIGRRVSDQNEYELDLNKLSGDPDNLMAHIKHLASALETCGFNGELQQMSLYHLRNQSVTCNDGTPAGYYLRKSYGSKKWLVFLEGSGILSPDPEENPIWWKANVVFIPYCSSDVWSGTLSASDTGSYAFMGALIVEEVLRELMDVGLMTAKEMVLAGSSAGGTAVLMSLDRVSDFMAAAGSRARVLGLADSGWFLETQQVISQRTDCTNVFYCNPTQAIQIGTKLWGSYVPKTCSERYDISEQWKCFIGFRIYEHLKTPIFLFQWLYDEAQLTVGMAGPPISLQHWNFMQKTGRDMRASLRNASVVFAPACYAHMVLTTSAWTQIQVRNVKLHKAVRCWLQSQKIQNEEAPVLPTNTGITQNTNTKDKEGIEHKEDLISDESHLLPIEGLNSVIDDFSGEQEIIEVENPNPETDDTGSNTTATSWQSALKHNVDSTETNRKKNKRRKSRRRQNSNRRRTTDLQGDEPSTSRRSGRPKCQLRLVDHATCPHCNPSCPKLTNPFTGEDMEFISFMRLFGLDLGAIAQQMGLDAASLALLDPVAAMQMLASAVRGQ